MTTLTNQPGLARGANASWSGAAGWIPSARGPQARRLAFEARQARAAREAAATPVLITDAAPAEAPLIIVHPPRVPAAPVARAASRPAACARPAACGSRARKARAATTLTAA